MPLTQTQQALLDEMKTMLQKKIWEHVPTGYGFTIRYSETHSTPELIPERWWPGKTYDRHQFLTLIGRSDHYRGSVIYRVARAPWVTAHDRPVTYKLAFAILRDPAGHW